MNHTPLVRWNPKGWDEYIDSTWGFGMHHCHGKPGKPWRDVDGSLVDNCDAYRPPIQTQRLDRRLTLTVEVWCWEHCPPDVRDQALRIATSGQPGGAAT